MKSMLPPLTSVTMNPSEPTVPPIERRDTDTRKSFAALCDYLHLGAGRSLRTLLDAYQETATNAAVKAVKRGRSGGGLGAEKPPTLRLSTLETWSTRHAWQSRAEAFDAAVEAARAALVRAGLRTGLAIDAERVDKLKRLATDLEGFLYHEDDAHEEGDPRRRPFLFLRDVKQIGGGETAKKEELFRYNSPLVSDYRAALDDLAKETGGRKLRADVTSNDEGIGIPPGAITGIVIQSPFVDPKQFSPSQNPDPTDGADS